MKMLKITPRSFHLQSRFDAFDLDATFVKISVDNQIGAPGAALPTSFVVQALDKEDKPMAGVSIRFAFYTR